MDFKVVFTDTFLEDLERIVRSIAQHNSEAARKLGEIIIRKSESLSFFPERYPRVRQRPGVRRLIVERNFKVFYRVQNDAQTVEILRCWDGRQQWEPHI